VGVVVVLVVVGEINVVLVDVALGERALDFFIYEKNI
jgi:hypothetical protein